MEYPLIFLAGLLGSSHCLGMCGGFALTVSSNAAGWRANVWRQLLYTCGRVFTYAVLGACAGFGGWRLAKLVPSVIPIPALLSLLAGAFLVYQGLAAAGVIGKRGVSGQTGCLAGSFLATFLVGPRLLQVFLAGVFTGLLPCGLLYGMLALAASTHALLPAMLTMILFGLGTAPAMMLTGLSGQLVSVSFRRHVFTFAAWCLVLTGGVSMVRGAGFLVNLAQQETATSPAKACPFCEAKEH
jgi:sulfite exporter TauE/SafE